MGTPSSLQQARNNFQHRRKAWVAKGAVRKGAQWDALQEARRHVTSFSDKRNAAQIRQQRNTAFRAGVANTALNVADAFTFGLSDTIAKQKEKQRNDYLDAIGRQSSAWWDAGDVAGKVGGQLLTEAAGAGVLKQIGRGAKWGSKFIGTSKKFDRMSDIANRQKQLQQYNNARKNLNNLHNARKAGQNVRPKDLRKALRETQSARNNYNQFRKFDKNPYRNKMQAIGDKLTKINPSFDPTETAVASRVAKQVAKQEAKRQGAKLTAEQIAKITAKQTAKQGVVNAGKYIGVRLAQHTAGNTLSNLVQATAMHFTKDMSPQQRERIMGYVRLGTLPLQYSLYGKFGGRKLFTPASKHQFWQQRRNINRTINAKNFKANPLKETGNIIKGYRRNISKGIANVKESVTNPVTIALTALDKPLEQLKPRYTAMELYDDPSRALRASKYDILLPQQKSFSGTLMKDFNNVVNNSPVNAFTKALYSTPLLMPSQTLQQAPVQAQEVMNLFRLRMPKALQRKSEDAMTTVAIGQEIKRDRHNSNLFRDAIQDTANYSKVNGYKVQYGIKREDGTIIPAGTVIKPKTAQQAIQLFKNDRTQKGDNSVLSHIINNQEVQFNPYVKGQLNSFQKFFVKPFITPQRLASQVTQSHALYSQFFRQKDPKKRQQLWYKIRSGQQQMLTPSATYAQDLYAQNPQMQRKFKQAVTRKAQATAQQDIQGVNDIQKVVNNANEMQQKLKDPNIEDTQLITDATQAIKGAYVQQSKNAVVNQLKNGMSPYQLGRRLINIRDNVGIKGDSPQIQWFKSFVGQKVFQDLKKNPMKLNQAIGLQLRLLGFKEGAKFVQNPAGFYGILAGIPTLMALILGGNNTNNVKNKNQTVPLSAYQQKLKGTFKKYAR